MWVKLLRVKVRLFHLQQEPSGKGNRLTVASQICGNASHFFLGLLICFPNKTGGQKCLFRQSWQIAVELNKWRGTSSELWKQLFFFEPHFLQLILLSCPFNHTPLGFIFSISFLHWSHWKALSFGREGNDGLELYWVMEGVMSGRTECLLLPLPFSLLKKVLS